jgi:antitoxin VapB
LAALHGEERDFRIRAIEGIYAIYITLRGNAMQTAKLSQNGRSQAVRFPKEFQFIGGKVFIQKHGDAVLLIPHEKAWEVFMEGLFGFSDDFMRDGRDQGEDQKREGQ